MKPITFISAILATLLSACSYTVATSGASSSSSSTSSVMQTTDSQESTIVGSGSANVAGNSVVVQNGVVMVNGVSYGAVAPTAKVRFVVAAQQSSLFVDGELRKPVQ